MKKSELRKLIKEELMAEGWLDKLIDSIFGGAKKIAMKQAMSSGKVQDLQKKIQKAKEEMDLGVAEMAILNKIRKDYNIPPHKSIPKELAKKHGVKALLDYMN